MGGIAKAVKGIFSGPEKVKPQTANKNYFDIAKEVKPAKDAYKPLLQNSQAASAAVAPQRLDVLKQMGLAATGQGPSLAEAQLKAAQDRNLAQQLAAIQATRGGNAAMNQRALMQNMGAAGRDLAQQASIARLQERDNFLNAANTADQSLRADISGKLGLDLMPKQSLQGWEMARVGAINQAQAANAQAQNAMTGALIGGAATIAGGMMGGPAGAAAGSQLGSAMSPGSNSAASAMANNRGYMVAAEGGLVEKKRVTKGAAPDQKYKKGGPVKGPGTTKSDSIPVLLSNKEFVLRAEATAQPGMVKALEKLNKNPEKYAPELVALITGKAKAKKPEKKA